MRKKRERERSPLLDPNLKLLMDFAEKIQKAKTLKTRPVVRGAVLRDLVALISQARRYSACDRQFPVRENGLVTEFCKALVAPDRKQMMLAYEAMYKKNSAKERLLTEPYMRALRAFRPKRGLLAKYKKLVHQTILAMAMFHGALPKTESDFLSDAWDPKPLTNLELKGVFDQHCFACGKPHSIEAIKSIRTRFLNDFFSRASKLKKRKIIATKMSVR